MIEAVSKLFGTVGILRINYVSHIWLEMFRCCSSTQQQIFDECKKTVRQSRMIAVNNYVSRRLTARLRWAITIFSITQILNRFTRHFIAEYVIVYCFQCRMDNFAVTCADYKLNRFYIQCDVKKDLCPPHHQYKSKKNKARVRTPQDPEVFVSLCTFLHLQCKKLKCKKCKNN